MTDNIVSTPKFVAFVIAFAMLAALLVLDDDGFIPIIDYTNTVFHEAGHFVFVVFGEPMGLYGGTLGQLLPPIISAVVFWRQKSLVSLSIALLWLFENFFDVAVYIETARSEGPIVLGVLGWGYHDWWVILSRWGALQYDTTLATIVRVIGWLGLFSTLVGTTYLWWQCKKIYCWPDYSMSQEVTPYITPRKRLLQTRDPGTSDNQHARQYNWLSAGDKEETVK